MPDYKNYNARKDGTYSKIWSETGKCVFCDLKEKYIIKDGNKCVLTVNLFPYSDGHLMVIPKRHFEKFEEMENDEWKEMLELSKLGIKLLRKTIKVKDVWVLFRASAGFKAGKTVTHAHLHLIPYKEEMIRWELEDITIAPVEMAGRLRGG